MSDLFRFEVPTSAGVFVVIGPDTLPPDEAERIAAKIARLIPLMVLEPQDDASEYGRLLAERDRLIGEGVDPADLLVPDPPF